MRVTEVTRSGRRWSPLVLHPRLTVVAGEPDQRAEVIEVLSTVYSIAGSTVGGTIEYSGFHMPLDQTAVVSLDIAGRGFVTIDQDAWERARSEMHSELTVGVRSRLAELEDARGPLEAEADALGRKCAAAEAATEAVTEELTHSGHLLEELAARLEVAERRPGELRSEMDTARVELDRAEMVLAIATERAPSLLGVLESNGRHVTDMRLGQEPTALLDAVAEAESVCLIGPERASELLGWLAEVGTGSAEPSQRITAMLSEIRHLEQRWEILSARGVEGEPEVIAARERYEEVAIRAANLEQLAGSGLVADRARAEIDAAHESKDPSEESRVLEMYGFDSYLDYTIALSTRSVGDAIAATVERSRVELVRATDALEMARESAAAERDELNRQRDELRERIQRDTGVEPESLTEEILSAIPELPAGLGDLPGEFEEALEVLRGEVRSARDALSAIEGELGRIDDPERIRSELEDRGARVEELEELSVRASEVGDQARDSLEEVTAGLQRIEVERQELLSERSSMGSPGEGISPTEVALALRAVIRQLDAAGSEPTPVLLADTFCTLGDDAPQVLEALAGEVPELQVVYVTGSDAVTAWAKRLKPDSGALVRAGHRWWIGRHLARAQTRRTVEDEHAR